MAGYCLGATGFRNKLALKPGTQKFDFGCFRDGTTLKKCISLIVNIFTCFE